jgi:hypothetical protein
MATGRLVKLMWLIGVTAVALPVLARAADTSADGSSLTEVRRELRRLEAERAHDRQIINQLEIKVDQLQGSDHKIQQSNQQLEVSNKKLHQENFQLQEVTADQIKTLEQKVDQGLSEPQFSDAFNAYLGSRRFVVTGTFQGSFQWDKATATNTYTLNWTPQINYQLNSWIYFVGQLSGSIGADGESGFAMPVASIMMFLNDYVELYGGIFDNPFGDWYEGRSAPWVNKFATAPLPFDGEPIAPPTDVGVQFRGGIQWGDLGQDADYTIWSSNGPSYDSSLPNPVVGQTLNAFNGVTLNTNGKAIGARFRVYPIPLKAEWGRLKFGAATLDGKWQDGLWYNAWALNVDYQLEALSVYGAWLSSYRQLPTGLPQQTHDNRQGWYLEADYGMNQIAAKMAMLPDPVQQFIGRTLLGVRYSGVNQNAIVASEISNTPAPAFNGSPSIFSPHAREVAMVLDYYFSPAIVWQNEFDLELPQDGGSLVTFGGAKGATPIYSPFGRAANDRAFISQITVGF